MFYKQAPNPRSWQGRYELFNVSLLEGSYVPALCSTSGSLLTEEPGRFEQGLPAHSKAISNRFCARFSFPGGTQKERDTTWTAKERVHRHLGGNEGIKTSQLCTTDLISCSQGATNTCHRGRATDVTSLCERGSSHLNTGQRWAPDVGKESHTHSTDQECHAYGMGKKAFCSAAHRSTLARAPGSNSSAGIQ